MSGSPYDDTSPGRDFPPSARFDAEFEADLQCALNHTSPVLVTAPAAVAAEVASRIHRESLGRRGMFLTIDCSLVLGAEQLELAFETAAPRGTIFLRDVDRLPAALQAQLYRKIVPLGVRVIASTSIPLLHAAMQGTFDERLFYRLNQIHLVSPSVVTGAA